MAQLGAPSLGSSHPGEQDQCMRILKQGAECRGPLETPTFGDIYHVTGIISLPYAEIREPFEAWYNLTGGKSRIEYYGGQVVTYQFGSMEPFGASFKVTPETTETELNVRKCFCINGTIGALIAPQSVFPSLENFRRVREERFRGQRCAVWQNVSYWGHKKNVYTLRVGSSARGPVPLHYEVRGFNSLLGSHYDKYEIDYSSFSHRFPPGVFQLPEGVQCEQWPTGSPEHLLVANPMQEFVGRGPDTDHVHHRLFHRYKEQFGKSYGSEEEHEHRRHTFIHNMRFVHSQNRAALSYTLALNHLADRTPQELAALRGRRRSGDPNNGQPFPTHLYTGLTLPESLDWRLY
ncbi:counting factor associated protein D-like, partial [Corapipo altera]|uniref:counting factor associated protein D-like n=1 Tax=Corapipo altera TaxID=415028 RepID=UPI000FD65E0C